MMKAFKEWLANGGQDRILSVSADLDKGDCCEVNAEIAWRAALRWYRNIAEKCENDCTTDKDFRTLYFHLKQVLKNEIGE